MNDIDQTTPDAAQVYWKTNLKLIIILLTIWAVVAYLFGIILARALNNIYLGQLPLGFWFAQQGSLYIFIILIFVYSIIMDKIDQQFGAHE